MRRRLAASVLGIAVMINGFAREDLGRRIPSCDPNEASSTILLEAQSVRDTEYIPCISDLKAGWSYEHVEARSGHARFWISSDRVGERFLEVTLRPACELGNALQMPSDEGTVPLFVDVTRFDYVVSAVVIPEGAGAVNRAYALQLADEIGASVLRSRAVRVTVDASDDPTEDRISRGLQSGSPVFVAGSREQEEATVELYLPPGGEELPPPQRLPLAEALEEIEDTLEDPVYEATWHYLFRSGCVTYEFDAHGLGVETLPQDVQAALGLYSVDGLRQYGEEFGYVLP
jgi:hypothetical protein